MISPAMQAYLKAVYHLGRDGRAASTNGLAAELKVAPASVTNMLKKLAAMGLLRRAPYRGVTLTRAGKKVALETIRHHRLLELYLAEALGVPWDAVHDEAKRLQGGLSEELEDRIARFLGEPKTDPHGHPIPPKNGDLREPRLEPLAGLGPGRARVIRSVSDEDPEMLRYLKKLGLTPGARVAVLERQPFNGPITVRVGGTRFVVGVEVARRVFV